MPEFNCGSCGKLLKTPAGTEGKQGRCPHCGSIMHIPAGKSSPPTKPANPAAPTQPQKPRSPQPTSRPPQSRPAANQPARPQQPQQRPAQRPGQQPAQRPAPQKPAQPKPAPQPRPAPGRPAPAANPFGTSLPPAASNPYAPPNPQFSRPGFASGRGGGAPHRGGIVMTLGIISLVMSLPAPFTFCLCFLPLATSALSIALGAPAWYMASGDLKAMNSGRMDRSGRGMTLAGLITGIIGIVISMIAFLELALYFVLLMAGSAIQ